MGSQPEDYFKLLGIDRNASTQTVKEAYRDLAKQYHPDKGGDEAKFQEIVNAHETLTNSDQRRKYEVGLDRAKQSKEKEDRIRARAPGKEAGSLFSEELKESLPRAQQPQPVTPRSSARPTASSRGEARQARTPPPQARMPTSSAEPPYRPPPAQTSVPTQVERPLDHLSNLVLDSSSVAVRFLVFLGAVAFTVCPALLMTHVFNHAGPLQLLLGPLCFIWAIAGVAATFAAGWALLVASVEAVGRVVNRFPWRRMIAALIVGGAAVLFLRALPISIPSVSLSSSPQAANAAERYPREFRPCTSEVPPRWGAERVLHCTPEDLVMTVILFGHGSSAEVFLNEEEEEVHAKRMPRCPIEEPAVRPVAVCDSSKVPFQRAFGIDGQRGHVLCYYGDGHIILVWSDLWAEVLTRVRFPVGVSSGQAWAWWGKHAY